MATVLDKGRVLKTKPCATNAFTQPTPRTFPRAYSVLASIVEPHIQVRSLEGANAHPTMPMAASAPVISLAAFWLAKVVAPRMAA